MKLLSLVLVFTLISTLVIQPSEAQASGNVGYSIIDQKVSNGEVVYQVLKVDNIFCYYEEANNITTCYSISQGTVDYVINDGTNVYTGKLQNNDNKIDFRAINKNIQLSYKDTTKKSLASYYSASNLISAGNLANTSSISTASASSTDTNYIMNWLYSYGGYPSAYSFKFIKSKTVNSVSISLYDTVSYNINQTNMWPIYIGTPLALVAGILTLDVAAVLSIASFAYSVYGGTLYFVI